MDLAGLRWKDMKVRVILYRRHVSSADTPTQMRLIIGFAIAIIIIFFCLQYPRNGTIGENNVAVWWGNVVGSKTGDYDGVAYLPMPESGKFGPETW